MSLFASTSSDDCERLQLCTQALGDLGADVIKIEPLGLGDETCGWPPFRGPGLGAVFLSVNRNKRSIALDLKTDDGRAVAHALARDADIAVESFTTGVAERLGIDAFTLQSINDRLIHCTISGFGRTGPLSQAPGYDVILQAFSGMMSLTGDENGGHIRSPVSPIDQMTGTHAFGGILAALLARQQSGKGTTVAVSLLETAIGLMRYNLQTFWEKGEQPPKCGSSHESLCPYQAFEAADGPIMIAVANDNLWRKFCAAAGLEHIADDPKFRTNANRVVHRAETLERVQSVVAQQSVAALYDKLSQAGVPCSPIYQIEQLLQHPQVPATGIILNYMHHAVGPTKAVAQPFTLNGVDRTAGLAPPLHGQHTEATLAEVGLPVGEIQRLKNSGIVA